MAEAARRSRAARVLRRLLLVVALLPLALYASACGYLFAKQRSLLFWPPDVERAALERHAEELRAELVTLVAEDGTRLLAWHRRGAGDRAVLFFHGSGETVLRTDLQALLIHLGWDVIVPSYRGYPGSEGTPTEEGLVQDARAAFRYVTGELGVPPSRVVLHGMSLGGGVATALAAEVDAGALVLESTFLSVPAAAAVRYPWVPVSLLVRDRFDSGSLAPGIEEPVLVVHSVADELIPVAHARELAGRFPHARYVEVGPRPHGATLTVETPAAREAYEALLERVLRTPLPG